MNEILAVVVDCECVVVVCDSVFQHVEIICACVDCGVCGWSVYVAVEPGYDSGGGGHWVTSTGVKCNDHRPVIHFPQTIYVDVWFSEQGVNA